MNLFNFQLRLEAMTQLKFQTLVCSPEIALAGYDAAWNVPKRDVMCDFGALPVFVGVEISLHQNGIHHSECQA